MAEFNQDYVRPGLDAPASDAVAVVPSDATVLTAGVRGLYVGVSGDVAVVTRGGSTVTFKSAPVGILPVCVQKVKATGTTATNLLALY